ncbi:MAG: GNAT family N-acetyltransferase [Thermoanaerobaculia bacterium]
MSNPPGYRNAKASDLDALVALDAICFPPEIRYSKLVMRYYALHRDSETFVAESNGSIVGFIIAHLFFEGCGEIVTIDVHPDARRLGIARELMRRAEESLATRGASIAFLEVDCDNSGALALYREFGYVVRERYLEGRTPRYLMEKTIG